ncbi:MAG: sialate O-acetylesterase [Oscillospiraceae bacterium]|nr:sialate O-acetylesterase [Oscillospiraceae bacterium]
MDGYDVVIQAGQSNSEGCGLGPTARPYVWDGSAFQMEPDLSVAEAREGGGAANPVGSFHLSFARLYKERYLTGDGRGRRLLILRTAVGGTGFADGRWGLGDDLFLRMMAMTRHALALGPGNNALTALLWHQGENDSGKATCETHRANLRGLVEAVRGAFAAPALPFVAGGFCGEWAAKNAAACGPIAAAIEGVCSDVGHAAFADLSDLPSNNQSIGNGDDIHFSRDALYAMGERYFKAYETLRV